MTIEEKAKLYDKALEKARQLCAYPTSKPFISDLQDLFPELKESEDERIRKNIISWLKNIEGQTIPINDYNSAIDWLEKQGKKERDSRYKYLEKQDMQKEINLIEILKHYPKETELYSPLYGKLWLAEVFEEYETITCYKHPLDEGCTRAILEQEDTVSFFPDGTTGLPDFTVSKDCMLFLYDIKKQDEQKPIISNDAIREGIAHFGITQYQIDNWLKKYVDVESQGEQKPADKVEPKFNVGDKIRRKTPSSYDKDMQVARIKKDYYICNHIGKFSSEVVPFSKESSYELIEQKSAWSEEDEVELNGLIKHYEDGHVSTPQNRKTVKWLKTLKDRVGCEANIL